MTLSTETTNETKLEPGTPEYDQAMAAKFDKSQETDDTVTTEERPSWLPEKFKSPEDLAKAYAELEKKQSQPKGDLKVEEKPAEKDPVEGEAQPTADEAQKAASDAGLDFNVLSEKVAQKGDLDPEDYAAFEARGIPRQMVEAYIAGQTALATQTRSEIVGVAGGEEQYGQITSWAAKNLSSEEIEAFNKVIDSGDVGQMKLAVAGLKARYESVNGSEPRLVTTTTGTASGEVFRSTQELTAAMRDPRYKTDPAYRADVQAKLARSSIL